MTDTVPILPATTTTDTATVHAAVAVLPVGSFEQHGPYLPLVTDTLIATAIAAAIAGHHQNVFQLPAITYGCSHEHAAFPGTVSISATTLSAVIADIAESCTHQGITALIIVNAHGGNTVLTNIAQQANVQRSAPCRALPQPRRLGRSPHRRAHHQQQPRRHACWRTRNLRPARRIPGLCARRLEHHRPRRTRSSLSDDPGHQRLHRHRRHWPTIPGNKRKGLGALNHLGAAAGTLIGLLAPTHD